MFKLKKFSWSLLVCSAMFFTLSFVSCSSDDDDLEPPVDECAPAFSTGIATGTFMGNDFTMVEGTATEDFADASQFRIVLYGETVMGDACDGFNFDKPKLSMIFSVPMLVGVYSLGTDYSVTFNDASVVNEVNADIAICGAVEITSVTDTQVSGKLDANANADSDLNGTFTVARCN